MRTPDNVAMNYPNKVDALSANAAPGACKPLEGVAFTNPNATEARMKRRSKLAASRARMLAASATCSDSAFNSADEEKEVRKQQRMLRNRESAALSRKRKSDRIDELEVQVECLEEENRQLRQRVDMYEFASGGGGGGAAAVTAAAVAAAAAPPPARPCTRYPHRASASAMSAISPSCALPSATLSTSNLNIFDTKLAAIAGTMPGLATASCFNNISRPAVFA